jgi:hypothetical protein
MLDTRQAHDVQLRAGGRLELLLHFDQRQADRALGGDHPHLLALEGALPWRTRRQDPGHRDVGGLADRDGGAFR